MAKRIVSIPHKFRLAGAISFRKDYSPPSSPPSRPYNRARSPVPSGGRDRAVLRRREDGLEGYFEIDLTGVIEMEVHDDEMVDNEDAGEEVHNAKDLELLERLQLGDDNEDEIPPLEHGLELLDLRDSDDETYDPANPDEDDYF